MRGRHSRCGHRQTDTVVGKGEGPACICILAGEKVSNVGPSGRAHRRLGDRNLGLPDMRFGQRLRPIVRSDVRGGLYKLQGMATMHVSMIGAIEAMCGRVRHRLLLCSGSNGRCEQPLPPPQLVPQGLPARQRAGGWQRPNEEQGAERKLDPSCAH